MPSMGTTDAKDLLDRLSDAAYERTVAVLAVAGFADARSLVRARLSGEGSERVPAAAADIIRDGVEAVGPAAEALVERIGRLERAEVSALEFTGPAIPDIASVEAAVSAAESRLEREREAVRGL